MTTREEAILTPYEEANRNESIIWINSRSQALASAVEAVALAEESTHLEALSRFRGFTLSDQYPIKQVSPGVEVVTWTFEFASVIDNNYMTVEVRLTCHFSSTQDRCFSHRWQQREVRIQQREARIQRRKLVIHESAVKVFHARMDEGLQLSDLKNLARSNSNN